MDTLNVQWTVKYKKNHMWMDGGVVGTTKC